jgi:hypothetical protein
VGPFDVEAANQITELENLRLTPLAQAAGDLFPTISLDDQEVIDLIHGKRIKPKVSASSMVAGVSEAGKLVAVLEPVDSDLKSVVVFQGELND